MTSFIILSCLFLYFQDCEEEGVRFWFTGGPDRRTISLFLKKISRGGNVRSAPLAMVLSLVSTHFVP